MKILKIIIAICIMLMIMSFAPCPNIDFFGGCITLNKNIIHYTDGMEIK